MKTDLRIFVSKQIINCLKEVSSAKNESISSLFSTKSYLHNSGQISIIYVSGNFSFFTNK